MLSVPHLAIIFLVALVVLGPDKLPEVARTMGKFMGELRRITGDFRYQVEGEMRELERQANMKKYAETEIGNYQPPAVVGSPQQQTENGDPALPQPPAAALPPEFTGDQAWEPAAGAPTPELLEVPSQVAPTPELPAAEPMPELPAVPSQVAPTPEVPPHVEPPQAATAAPSHAEPAPAPAPLGETVPRDKPGDPHPA